MSLDWPYTDLFDQCNGIDRTLNVVWSMTIDWPYTAAVYPMTIDSPYTDLFDQCHWIDRTLTAVWSMSLNWSYTDCCLINVTGLTVHWLVWSMTIDWPYTDLFNHWKTTDRLPTRNRKHFYKQPTCNKLRTNYIARNDRNLVKFS